MLRFSLSILVLLAWIAGCSSVTAPLGQNVASQADKAGQLGNVEWHTAELAKELFIRRPANLQYRYAVAGFVPVVSQRYAPEQQHPLMLLGHQLEEGMITEAARRGLVAREFKLTKDIIVSDSADRVLSRDLAHLDSQLNVDFYITGTITEQQGGAMVNARIIDVYTRDIVAAATRFFPDDLFWETERVTTRGNKLYRSAR